MKSVLRNNKGFTKEIMYGAPMVLLTYQHSIVRQKWSDNIWTYKKNPDRSGGELGDGNYCKRTPDQPVSSGC